MTVGPLHARPHPAVAEVADQVHTSRPMMNVAAMIRLAVTTRRAHRDRAMAAGMVAWVVADHGRVGGLQGQVAAGAAHRDPGVRRGQGRGVVDAVPDNGDALPAGFQFPHSGDLVVGAVASRARR